MLASLWEINGIYDRRLPLPLILLSLECHDVWQIRTLSVSSE